MKLRFSVQGVLGLAALLMLVTAMSFLWHLPGATVGTQGDPYVGSTACIDCHERFYELWAPSHHGSAMQTVTPALIQQYFPKQRGDSLQVGGTLFSIEPTRDSLFFVEHRPDRTTRYAAVYALGGKNVFYFLTRFPRGRLQALPVAYDLNREEWYDNPESALRRLGQDGEDAALPWTHVAFTFNTSCWGCHVSQVAHNYNLESDSYRTVWKEDGINCETCHGPGGDHVRVSEETGQGNRPADLRIVSAHSLDQEQQNGQCGSCHAKMRPITASFPPGGRFFDHFDLTTLESRDFYPDGRDLGEDYTYTSWLQSPCVISGTLDCVHCHTSSGRYRFTGADANNACMPCHTRQVADVEGHSHHPPGSLGTRCISCHMPKSEFARMFRTDHSMRPPSPLAAREFGSPNACNECHSDRSLGWSQAHLVGWNKSGHQEEILERGRLIRDARLGNWQRLDRMLELLDESQGHPVFAASVLRLTRELSDERKWPGVLRALDHPSPLVRSAAARSLSGLHTSLAVESLLKSCADSYRLVRISSAEALSSFPEALLRGSKTEAYLKALQEYVESLLAREDDWASHADLGGFYLNLEDYDRALEQYLIAVRLHPEDPGPLVNAGLAYGLKGDRRRAEEFFRKAIAVEPENQAANLNYALLLGEMGRLDEAAGRFRGVLRADPESAVAAYNLSVIQSSVDLESAIGYARQAARSDPDNPRYAYTLAYYVFMAGRLEEATSVLERAIETWPAQGEAYLLLHEAYRQLGDNRRAREVARKGMENPLLADGIRAQLRQLLEG